LPSFWFAKCQHDGIIPTNLHINPSEVDFKLIYLKQPFGRNLIANPSGELGPNGWYLSPDSYGNGYRWHIMHPFEQNSQFPVYFAAFDNAFQKETIINFREHGIQDRIMDQLKPLITVSEYSRACPGSSPAMYSFMAQLLRDGEQPNWRRPPNYQSDVFFRSTSHSLTSTGWQQSSHQFDRYPTGIRLVAIRTEGAKLPPLNSAASINVRMAKASVIVSFK